MLSTHTKRVFDLRLIVKLIQSRLALNLDVSYGQILMTVSVYKPLDVATADDLIMDINVWTCLVTAGLPPGVTI